MKEPPVKSTHATCTKPLKTITKRRETTPPISKAPPAALKAPTKDNPIVAVIRIIKGPSFCQDKSKKKLNRDKLTTTRGTQKCNGMSPILNKTPAIRNEDANAHTSDNMPPSSIIREPLVWATK